MMLRKAAARGDADAGAEQRAKEGKGKRPTETTATA
jgi:hypothetical protein